MSRRSVLPAAVAAVLTLAAVVAVCRAPVVLEHGSGAWRRLVRGPTEDGVAYPGASVLIAFPDLPRGHARAVAIEAASLDAAPAVLSVSIDGAAQARPVAVDGGYPARIAVPPRPQRGLRLGVAAVRGAPPARLQRVRVSGAWPPLLLLALCVLAAAGTTAAVARAEELVGRAALAVAAASAGAAAAFALVASGAVASGLTATMAALLAAPLVLAAVLAARVPERGALLRAVAMVAAIALGAAARWMFAPAPGSWDMDYYRVWIETAVERGVTGAYGPPLETGILGAAAGNAGPLWAPTRGDRVFNIDYPPLAVASWRAAVAAARPAEDADWNVALKLPAMMGDVAAVLILAFLWPGGRKGAWAAAAYWAVPASWLSSAALGYLDGAYVPILLLSAIAAATGRPVPAGAALAAAALVKPTALVAAPALAVALRAPRRILIAAAAGLAVVALVLLPFALDGTAGAAVAQVRKILHQERLSAGYANPWWIAGAVVSGEHAPVPVLRLDAVPFPARPIGLVLLAAAVALLARALARSRGIGPTVAAAGALFAAYGVLATSVHANHPHPVGLLLIAAVAAGAAPGWPAAVLVLGYALNILFDEGLARVAGPRYGVLADGDSWVDTLRLGAGVDLTLVLAAAQTAAFVALVAWLIRRSTAASD